METRKQEPTASTSPVGRLGRGLGALIPAKKISTATQPAPASAVSQIPIDAIRPNPNQPRREFDDSALAELSNSIRINGVLQPIVVRPLPEGRFELVAGERRWRASQRAGLRTIPATIREMSDPQSLEIALIENLQRQDLGPLERAEGYQRYLDQYGGTTEQLAVRLSESRTSIINYLRLLKLPQEVRTMISGQQISMGHARAIAGLSDPERQLAIAKMTARRSLSVRQVEAMCRESSSEPSPARTPTGAVRHMESVADQLSRGIGLPVQVITGKGKNSGRVIVSYKSIEDFDRIARAFGADSLIG
ncbi:MAG: ParB/RepB/Spo0J family partition protein [Phycisphaerales bacterium]|nr:ParB/RepB/Spo0J family partition protein [Phycisphaerales bacterium]